MSLEQLVKQNKKLKSQSRALEIAENIYKKEVIQYFQEHLAEYIDGITVSLEDDSYRGTDYYPYTISRVTFKIMDKQDCKAIINLREKVGIDWFTFDYKQYSVSIYASKYQEDVQLFFDNEKNRESYPEGIVQKNNIAFINSIHEFLKEHNINITPRDEKAFKHTLKEEVDKALVILSKKEKQDKRKEQKQSKIKDLFNKYLFRE